MQFFILLLGALLFVFYQFETPPVVFNHAVWAAHAQGGTGDRLRTIEAGFAAAHAEERADLNAWLAARRAGDPVAAAQARAGMLAARQRTDGWRTEAQQVLAAASGRTTTSDADYVFITFILDHLPHGVIGLLVAVFFAAALSSKSAELNALGATTTVDLYRHVIRREATDAHYVAASKWFTALWGLVAVGFALCARLAENLIQAVNILGSIFYGVMLGLFLVAFFLRWVGGTAVFWAAAAAQVLVFVLYFSLSISYLWYNLIGCAACVGFSVILQTVLGAGRRPDAAQAA